MSAVVTYRKKPVVIEAVQYLFAVDGHDADAIERFGAEVTLGGDDGAILVWNVPEGCDVKCPDGHWIIKGVKGEFYPCEPAIFEATYEPVEEPR